MSALQRQLADVARQWRANARLRTWTLVAAGIVGVYVFLVLSDWRMALAREHSERAVYMRKLRTLAGEPEWLERAQAASRLRKALEAQVSRAGTLGIAQAEVQGWARERVAALGGQAQVAAQAPAEVEGQPGLWRVPVVISGTAAPDQVLQLAQLVEQSQALAVVEQSTILNRENRTFSLTVVFYYRVEGGADVAD